eukprot:jgi/Tetstr1/422834/TSEL_013625.t1
MCARIVIKDTLAEIQERHSAVKELERSLLELHQIFMDMAVLVEQQGEMLNNIEAQVAKSVDYVVECSPGRGDPLGVRRLLRSSSPLSFSRETAWAFSM